MNLYKEFQPVTWNIGIIDAQPKDIAEITQPKYIPPGELDGIYQEKKTIDEALANLEPIKSNFKFLLIETVDRRTVLFNSCPSGGVELPTWSALRNLGVSAYYICNVPNTISKDRKSGAWGARKIEYRTLETPYGQDPAFGVQVINDCGRWHFCRYGEIQSFENENAYKSFRKPDRFTEDMLFDYCSALAIPVYDRNFYTENCIIIAEKSSPDIKGMTYKEAAKSLRISGI